VEDRGGRPRGIEPKREEANKSLRRPRGMGPTRIKKAEQGVRLRVSATYN